MEGILKELQNLTNEIAVFGPRAVVGLFIFLFFWLLSIIIKTIIMDTGRKFSPGRKQVFNLIGKLVKGILLVLAAVIALGKMGINVTALVAGLGLTGFALGFALRDVLSNVLAGALILMYRPFQLNDRISVAGFEGNVIDIDLRYTTLQAENKKILIPNSTLFTNAVSVLKVEN
ncbi:MAG: hypothetical protein AMJ90_04070 [candidate division Zixibacteria bacterium SM23_73_2]|nr:MAG: hypothetical protein AMJ90_04070 [candidate division Zixibacteria bacterium SM23_73_2]